MVLFRVVRRTGIVMLSRVALAYAQAGVVPWGGALNLPHVKNGGGEAVPTAAGEAVVLSLSKDVSVTELEKHLDDYRKGRAYLSGSTAGKLRDMHAENGEALSVHSPKSFNQYLAYSSGMDYEQRGRYINFMSDLRENLDHMDTPAQQDFSLALTDIIAAHQALDKIKG